MESEMELNGKKVINIELDGLHKWDAPDYCDAYVAFACWEDGTPLTDEELDNLSEDRAQIHARIFEVLPL
jgi:hypothetical protein